MSVRHVVLALAAMLVAAIATPAEACTLCSCTTSTTALNFGNYDPVTASPDDASAAVSIDCSGVVSLFGLVEVKAGTGQSSSFAQRTMRRLGVSLNYNLFANSPRTQILGDGTGGTTTVTSSLNGLLFFSTSVPVYGRAPAGQWVAAGTYTDTIQITVQY